MRRHHSLSRAIILTSAYDGGTGIYGYTVALGSISPPAPEIQTKPINYLYWDSSTTFLSLSIARMGEDMTSKRGLFTTMEIDGYKFLSSDATFTPATGGLGAGNSTWVWYPVSVNPLSIGNRAVNFS